MNEPVSDRRVVVITGGSDGIGAAAARVLARRGDHLVLVGRSPGKDWRSGAYFANRKPATSSPLAGNTQLAEQLWDRSMTMCGLQQAGTEPV